MNFKNCIALLFFALSLTSCVSDHDLAESNKLAEIPNALDKPVVKKKVVYQTKSSKKAVAETSNKKYEEEGDASWYGERFHGRKTASGPRYDMHEYTAAHRSLPLPSVVKVINLENRKSVMVVVNDRGPYYDEDKRIIDMSKKAAKELGFLKKGITKVKVEYLPNETKRLKSKLKPNQYSKAISKYKHLITKDVVTAAEKVNIKS